MHLRALREDDYSEVIAVIDDWWGGRAMADMLPRLFFKHFVDTSFAVEHDEHVIAFLCGFVSQTDPIVAYIHFVGVDPTWRGENIGRALYEAFFTRVRERGCEAVECVTATGNVASQSFHRRMGFTLDERRDYDGRGGDRVVMVKRLEP